MIIFNLKSFLKFILITLFIHNILNTNKFISVKNNIINEYINNIDDDNNILNINENINEIQNQNNTKNITKKINHKIKYRRKRFIRNKYINRKNEAKNKDYNSFYSYGISYEELKIFLEYINLSKKGILLYKQNLVKSKNPKITVVISVYNREKYIKASIKSVQNQKMKDLEIIVVDDGSTDNSVKYIKSSQEEDPRIILLQNKKNMGPLYSKSRGVLDAKGEYIYILDSDDMIGIDDYLEVLYDKAKKGNYDFVESVYVKIDTKRKYIARMRNFKYFLWTKLIKTNLYKDIIKKIGNDILNRGIVQEDDTIINYFLYDKTKHKELYKLGIIYFVHHGNQVWVSRFANITKYCKNYANLVNALYDIGYNTTNGKKLSFIRLKDKIIHSSCINVFEFKEMNEKLLMKFQNSSYITKSDKKIIKEGFDKLKKLKKK